MFIKNFLFLKNACEGMLSNADTPYLKSLTILVWVMPVSILLFAVGLQRSSLALAISISVVSSCWMFWQQVNTRANLTKLPILTQRK